jgi:hypothetical protein
MLLASNPTNTTELLDKKIPSQSYAEGELSHCAEVFTTVFNILSDENSLNAKHYEGPVGRNSPYKIDSCEGNFSPIIKGKSPWSVSNFT